MSGNKEYYIFIKGQKCFVSEKTYKAYHAYKNKMTYSENSRKKGIITVDNENGKVIISEGKEDSLERVIEFVRQIPDNRKPCTQERIEMKLTLEAALSCLSKFDRRLIELHYLKGYSLSELSAIFKVPISTLYKRRDDILSTLREILSE